MTDPGDVDTEQLLRRAGQGDIAARDQLLARHRPRLRQAVAVRLDRRLAPRVDPSDVVQETLELAKIRTVDLGDLPRLGRVLPALHSSSNTDTMLEQAGVHS